MTVRVLAAHFECSIGTVHNALKEADCSRLDPALATRPVPRLIPTPAFSFCQGHALGLHAE